MKLIVFGATGTVGIQLLKQALQQGYEVTAFARSPEKLNSLPQTNLKIFKGDILSQKDTEDAMHNQDAVLCALGDGNKGKIRATGTKNIITAMQRNGIRRLICQTTMGLGESQGNLNFFWKHIMFGLLLKKAFQDHQLQEHYLLDSNLDFTIVRPSAFTDGEVTRNYKIGFDGTYKKLSLKISRADVADFMLQQLDKTEYLKSAVSISN
jgi:putative NADH-flavin reductase